MERNYVKQIIGNKRYKLAPNTNTNIQTQLEEKTKPLTEYDVIDIVNVHTLFEEERQKSFNYRINGKLNIYTSNVLSTGATSMVWDPLFYGNPAVTPNNWVMQITYPSTMDYNYLIQARIPSGTISSNAYRGLQYQSLGTTIVNGDNKLTIKGIQRHNLVVDDYIYLYSNSSFNSIQGIHKVISLGIEGINPETDITLDTIISTPPSGFGNFVRIVEPSFDDITFSNPGSFSLATATDISGSTFGTFQVGEIIYTTITTTISHNLSINDFVEIRTNNINTLNGVWRVYNIIGPTKFVIRNTTSNVKGTNFFYTPAISNWKILDGTPSEYYIRNFEVLTTNDYDVYTCSYSTSIYSDTSDPTVGTANNTWLFQYNQDISTERLRDNRNGYVSEMYYTIMKRAGKNPYNWSNVTSDWEFNSKTSNTSNGLELISKNNSIGIGTIEKYSARTETIDIQGQVKQISGDKYIGDFVEYNSLEIIERNVADIIHRFGVNTNPNGEGYYYKPFKKLKIRAYSVVKETAAADEIIIDVPDNYVTYGDGSIGWKDLLTVGFYEEGINGVDYPFLNNSHYYYLNHNLFVRRQVPVDLITQNASRDVKNLTEEC